MSIVLTGDGTITSSVAITTLTLNDPVFRNKPREFIGNMEMLEGDGGVLQFYKKGRRSLRHTLRIPFLSATNIENLLELFETVDQTNWFTLQDHTILTKTAIAQEAANQNDIIQHSTAFSNWFFPRMGLTAFCITGTNQGQRRRIKFDAANAIQVSSAFSNIIVVGDTFLVGIPVYFETEPIIEPASHNLFVVELNFREKIY